MSSLTFRPRPIDIHKALPIVRKELDGTEVDAEIASGVRRSVPLMPTGMEREDEEEAHIAEAIKQSLEQRPDRIDIPTPVVIIVEGYDTAPDPHPFVRPNTYIHWQDRTPEEEEEDIEYDADDEDTEFLEKLNMNNKKNPLSESKYEIIIDKLEKEAGRLDGSIPTFNSIERIVPGIKSSVMQLVYKFWIEKRKAERTPLNHRYLKPPDPEDPDPYKAFRVRTEEKMKKKGRKNDQFSLVRMRQLRQEMERARTLLEMIKKREKLKKDYANIVQQLVEAQLAEPKDRFLESLLLSSSREPTRSTEVVTSPEIPPARKKQKRTPQVVAAVPLRSRRPSAIIATEPVEPTNMDYVYSEESSSDESEEEEEVEETPDWPHPDSFFANGAVDILGQKLNNTSMINLGGRMGSFRGRCRVGRGGRVIFDRRPIVQSNGIVHSFETDEECPTRLNSLVSLYTSGLHPLSAGRSDVSLLLKRCERMEASAERRKLKHMGPSAIDTT